MSLNLHIDRLVVEGLPLESSHQAHFRGGFETELGHLILRSLQNGHLQSTAMPSMQTLELSPAAGASPAQLGRQVARTLVKGLPVPASSHE